MFAAMRDDNGAGGRLSSYPLAVIDDLGAERDTSYAPERAFGVVDERCRSGLLQVVTSNMPPEALDDVADPRRARVLDRERAVCVPVKVIRESRRAAFQRHKMKYFRQVLLK
jgi:DNA replication protein DnaC